MRYIANFSLDGSHVWDPSPFRLGERLFLIYSAWPVEAGFEGWRTHSSLHVVELDANNLTPTRAPPTRIGPPGTGYPSVVNGRVVSAPDGLHLFFSGIRGDGRCDIGHCRLDPQTLTPLDVTPNILPFEEPSRDQGPTNPAPVRTSGGSWFLVYRKAIAPGQARRLYAAMSHSASGPWKPITRDQPQGEDIEDPFVWLEDEEAHVLVRDLGGTITGVKWPAIGLATSSDFIAWQPAKHRHILNRSLPVERGETWLFDRVERPALLVESERRTLFVSTYNKAANHTAIRALDWSDGQPYLEKGSAPRSPSALPSPDAAQKTMDASQIIQQVKAANLTYLPEERLESLASKVERLKSNKTEGLIVEFGVALGGSGILMSKMKGVHLRYRGYDLFGKIPPPRQEDGEKARIRFDEIESGRSSGIGGDPYYGYVQDLFHRVRCNFADFGVPVDGESIDLLQGYFEDVVRFCQNDRIVLAHIDCDWYAATRFCLNSVAPYVQKWGAIIVDDFSDWEGCRKATHEFLAENPDFLLREVQPHAVIQRFYIPDA